MVFIAPARGADTVSGVLSSQASIRGDAPFLVFEREPGVVETTSWAEQDARARQTAAALADLGISADTRFGVHLGNSPDFYDIWFAAAYLGAVMVPTNPLSTAAELRYLLGHSGCRTVLTQTDLVPTVQAAGAEQVIDVGGDWTSGAHHHAGPPDATPGDVLGVLYTSGTTSRPKGVQITHAAYLAVGDAVADHVRLRPDDRFLIVLPLFHGNAQYYCSMSALVTGASIALTPRFSAGRWSEQAAALGATIASLFAAPIRMILAKSGNSGGNSPGLPPDPPLGPSLRATLFAQNVSPDQAAEFERRFRTPLVQLYGMTETVIPPTMNPLYETRNPLSIGRPLPGARLRIVDSDGADVAPGTPGELLVGGEPGRTLMSGYLDDPDATAAALVDGWLHTGDVVRADADGFLFFVDRSKDMIKRSGENVACGEIERVVDRIEGVLESAAVGIPDAMLDEAIHVYVVPRPQAHVDPADVIAQCRGELAKFKVPDAVHIVSQLPRTSVGKIQKHLLRRPATPAPMAQAEHDRGLDTDTSAPESNRAQNKRERP
ncbi:class I adenylate-forming enzyme family protein [Streptomyces sporangiiformans]|uniref:ATP-dependent acyl-CoA ligase n=1 Tax=Streptomyces sporangiiformans TaxID=2315329 RepID=A0A505DNS8_9ACTN|nr:AMP-binding protein [Streptomyces sporangiiformans]TPQ22897.1 ATP-dependent acyl-CoA ligase [Streptomyces sporangiiformans]